ncbi:MAG: ornithine decarboxylase, partial [Saprospiraceae bacterium]|nr:ornithine decarboxylase [Saprospiraceae bacterium]
MSKNKASNTKFYNIGQFRVHYWNNLKQETAELARCQRGSKKEKKHSDNARQLLDDLSAVEHFFSFPGVHRLEIFRGALKKSEYMSLSNHVAETTRQLVSDSYRSHPDILEDDHYLDENEDREPRDGNSKNDFEVLFVEEMSEEEEKTLRTKLKELRNPAEKFSYNIVVQRSFQDAIIALQFNHNIQAVVIRYAPPFRSQRINGLIKPYIDNVLNLDLSTRTDQELGPLLGLWIKQFRPELD